MIGQRVAPPDVLAKLREIDPKADLVHLDGMEWLLGVRAENPAAKHRSQKQLQLASDGRMELADAADRAMVGQQIAREIEVLQLCAGGFRPIQLYRVDDSTPTGWVAFKPLARRRHAWGEVIEDFRLRDWNWRHRPEAAFAELKDELSIDAGNERRTIPFRDRIQAKTNEVFRTVFKKAKQFAVNISLKKAA